MLPIRFKNAAYRDFLLTCRNEFEASGIATRFRRAGALSLTIEHVTRNAPGLIRDALACAGWELQRYDTRAETGPITYWHRADAVLELSGAPRGYDAVIRHRNLEGPE